MCHLHSAFIMVELLKKKGSGGGGSGTQGASALSFTVEEKQFRAISANIPTEEAHFFRSKSEQQIHQVQEHGLTVKESDLVDTLQRAAQDLTAGERYEMALRVYKMLLPYYELQLNWIVLFIFIHSFLGLFSYFFFYATIFVIILVRKRCNTI